MTNTRYANANPQMHISLDEHMILPEIWQYEHTSILKYKMLEEKTFIETMEKEKGKSQNTNTVNKATS